MQTKTYTVLTEGFIFGSYREKGAEIVLNEAQAKDFLREGRLTEKGGGGNRRRNPPQVSAKSSDKAAPKA